MPLEIREYQIRFSTAIRRGDWIQASRLAEECRGDWPDEPIGWLLGSIAALAGGQASTALEIIDEGLHRRPDDFQCLLQRAEALLALSRLDDALAACEAATTAAGESPGALDAVGEFLVQAREHERAVAVFDRAVLAAPGNTHLLGRRATVNRWLGRFEDAERDLQRVLELRPNDGAALKELGELRLARGDQASVPTLQAALASAADPEQVIALHFALAKALDDAADPDQSWRHLETANNLHRARINYSSRRDQEIFERILAGFGEPEATPAERSGESPIFIVGLPRTGTTLVERALGSHSQVHPGGELPCLSEAISAALIANGAADLDWKQFASLLPTIEGPAVAREYLRLSQPWRGRKDRFTDKQPVNFFYCPLILRAFPNARIVHVKRHPMAAAYAIYKTRFQRTYPFAYDLAELADFIVGYHGLMAHWHRILPGRIFDLAYEDLVTSQESATRSLLDYCGLSFEPACLEFHKLEGAVMTASAVQVRLPLYDSSIDRWRRYEKWLEPARRRFEAAGIPSE